MLSKSKIKQIHSLEIKKYRDIQQLFIAEGNKLVPELMKKFECEWMIARAPWVAAHSDLHAKELIVDECDDIHKISLLKTPQDILAVFKKPVYNLSDADPASQLILALDGIQDPGNLGTIIRLADWFGIEHLVCSLDTVDAFAPKVVQATMGALARVQVHYTALETYIQSFSGPCYGTFLDGENIYPKKLSTNGIIVMGNEGNGIRPYIEKFIHERIFIPNYPANRESSESLNVAVATAIVCAEFRRRQIG